MGAAGVDAFFPPEKPLAGPPPPAADPKYAINRRVVATILDSFVFVFALFALVLASPADFEAFVTQPHYGFLILGFASFVYFVVLESLFGQTLGKRLVGIRVVDLEYRQPGFGRVLVRTLLRGIDETFLCLVGLITIIFTIKKQRIGDLAAGTLVVRSADVPGVRLAAPLSVLGVAMAIAGAPALLAASPASALVSPPPAGDQIEDTIDRYLDARAERDGKATCAELSEGERRDVVSTLSGRPVMSVKAKHCRRYGAKRSKRSMHLMKRVDVWRGNVAGLDIRTDGYAASAFAPSDPKALFFLYQSQEEGWKIDSLAYEKAEFVERFELLFTRAPSECLFDELRARGYDTWPEFEQLFRDLFGGAAGGTLPPLVAEAMEACPAR